MKLQCKNLMLSDVEKGNNLMLSRLTPVATLRTISRRQLSRFAVYRVARLAVLQPNFSNLAVFQVGWPYDYWVGHF